MISYGHHRYPGRLFVVEGTDGSGKIPIRTQQRQMREIVSRSEREAQRKGGAGQMKQMKFYDRALPGIEIEPYSGMWSGD